MPDHAKRYQTQWAAQFYAAAELTRRGYLVSLTFGNAPIADLLVSNSSGIYFMVDVKGMSTRNFWIIRRPVVAKDLYFILVYLPKQPETHIEYAILRSEDMVCEMDKYKNHCIESGRGWKEGSFEGIPWTAYQKYCNGWNILPGWSQITNDQ